MKRSAIIVNTARSGLINEKEMIDALRSGQIMAPRLIPLMTSRFQTTVHSIL
ncbi:D-3-phosphoglycerate dehydrogenase [Klebsiella pneumoniae]|uniref:D-3-phosphoglycerate dehydrogenase n=1 Tax=Klebsiella pneumoniae TaxID=573 RepID=A0A377TN72_KLEPN|nr:D-3-phosphoglycerate dehydrogenase [Klebsiella pneumoniae]